MADGRDWNKTGTVEGMADWLRSKSGALAVIVVRVNDGVLAADLEVAPHDAGAVVADRLPGLMAGLQVAREHKRKAGRAELEPVRE
jgi:hypothetical protein